MSVIDKIVDKIAATFNFGGKNNRNTKNVSKNKVKNIQNNKGNTFNGDVDLSTGKTVNNIYNRDGDDKISPEDFFKKHILDVKKWKKNNGANCFCFYFSEKPEYSIVFSFDEQQPNRDYIRLLYLDDSPGWHTVELRCNSNVIYRDFWSEMDGGHGTTLVLPDVKQIKTMAKKVFYNNSDFVWFLFNEANTLKALLQEFIFQHDDVFNTREDDIAKTYILKIENHEELNKLSKSISTNFDEINFEAANSNFLDEKQYLSDNERHIAKTIKVISEKYHNKK